MRPVLLVLHTFSTVEAHRSVEIYAVLRLESMHVLSFGVSRLLKKCLINMLSDDMKTVIALRKSDEDSRPFNQNKRIVLSELNKFLRLIAK